MAAVTVGLCALAVVLTFPFDPERRVSHFICSFMAHHFSLISPFWRCEFEGRENLRGVGACVFVANHQSFADIVILFGLFKHFKWVSKDLIFRIPFLGWNMLVNGYIPLNRTSSRSTRRMINLCRSWLDRGVPIMMFPEGTRSVDGNLQIFRDGPFRLAAMCGVPVVPLVVDGTHDILPKRAKRLNFRGAMRVRILPPVLVDSADGDPMRLKEEVRGLMERTLCQMRSSSAPVCHEHEVAITNA
jgi:1-acyl-sn-glycerol-3-phosphate acyltransferase